MALRIGGFDMTDIRATGGATTPAVHFPWEITVEQNESKNWSAKIRPGTINQLVPSNIFEKFSLSTGTYHVKLRCDGGNGGVNNSTVVVDTSPATENKSASNTPPPQFWITLGLIVLTQNQNY